MKFLQDYLQGIFKNNIGNVKINLSHDNHICSVVELPSTTITKSIGSSKLIQVELEFICDSSTLPERLGSLRLLSKHNDDANLCMYRYLCLYGKETSDIFRYALGYDD